MRSLRNSILLFAIGFTVKQVQRLYSRFKTLDKRDCGFLTREDLLCIPEVMNE
jgi:Ca2+-binding EF-hand superfamily protein